MSYTTVNHNVHTLCPHANTKKKTPPGGLSAKTMVARQQSKLKSLDSNICVCANTDIVLPRVYVNLHQKIYVVQMYIIKLYFFS